MDYIQYLNTMQSMIDQNNQWSAQQAERQMQFQSDMSNTAHQREVADLVAAGLNPVLSAHGQGASTPNGAMAQGNGALGAMAQMLSTIIDTENANARAALAAASRGSGSGTTALGNSNYLTDFLMALGMNRNQAYGIGNTVSNLGGLDGLISLLTGSNNTTYVDAPKKSNYHNTTNSLTSLKSGNTNVSLGAASAYDTGYSKNSNKTILDKIIESPTARAIAKGIKGIVDAFTK